MEAVIPLRYELRLICPQNMKKWSTKCYVGLVAQSVNRLATNWTVRDRIPVGVQFFAHVQAGPGAHPASCTMGTGSFPGVKRQWRGADHPPPSSAEVTKG
jgi:hypothetical protein